MTTVINQVSTELTAVDRLGLLLAQIADLEEQAEAIKNELKNGAEGVVEGNLFKANVILSQRSTVDNKALYKALNVSDDLLAKFTKTSAVISVKVTSR